MGRKIGQYVNNMNKFLDVDFHDFIDMAESGLLDEEIAKELGVHKDIVKKLKNEIHRDF